MKSDNLLLLLVVGGAAYYILKSAPGTAAGSSTALAYSPVTSQPGMAIAITANPNTVIPGSSTAYNQYLPPDQQVDPNDPPPIHCQAGQWPTRTTNLQLSASGWYCASPRVMI